MSRKPKLALLGNDRQAIESIHQSLQAIFGNDVTIHSYSVNDKVDASIPVVIVNHSCYYKNARHTFPNSTIIVAKSTLTGHNLEKLLLLPPNKKVFIVNNSQIAILETIQSLILLNIKHLEYIPYISDAEVTADIDTAITAGMTQLCPPTIHNVIDIGFRTISIDSFSKVLLALGLNSSYLDSFKKHYRHLRSPYSKSVGTHIKEDTCSKMQEGLLVLDANKQIVALNKVMEKILTGLHTEIVNKQVREVLLKCYASSDLLYDMDDKHSSTIYLNDIEYVYNLTTIKKDSYYKYIFCFNKVVSEETYTSKEISRKVYVPKYSFSDIWSSSPELKTLRDCAASFSKNNLPILISGESGTGKRLIAHAIHSNSNRSNNPFLPINLSTLPDSLIESELFGYEAGACMGFQKDSKAGYFEVGKGGTIFIDEIGDMPLKLQTRLLHMLQKREITRLGCSKAIPIDVRIIAATKLNLREQVLNNKFRADLYYHLNILVLETTPLRFLKNIILEIFFSYLKTKYNYQVLNISKEVKNIFSHYSWPGNVRELLNIADYIFYTGKGEHILSIGNIPPYILKSMQGTINSTSSFKTPIPRKKIKNDEIESFITAVLEILLYAPGKKISRRKLMKQLHSKGYDVSEYFLKVLLRKMQSLDMLYIGRTKQGTKVTATGFQFFKEQHHKPSY